jgi:hypothetical protein
MAHYVALDGPRFEKFLADKGFLRGVAGSEIVYSLSVKEHPRFVIRCYTTIADGDVLGRNCGADAIRVCAILNVPEEHRSFGIWKSRRVYRTGSQRAIEARTNDRIDEAHAKIREHITGSGAYAGAIGSQLRMELTVVARMLVSNRTNLFTFKDANGRTFIYWTDKDILVPSKRYVLSFTVKAHDVFNGVKRTTITEVRGKQIS